MIIPQARMAGYFTITKWTPGGVLLGEWKFRNLITNRGLDLLGNALAPATYVYLSTSTATPAVTDTAMGGTVVNTATGSPIYANTNTISGTSPYTCSHLRGWRFTAGQATGTWSSIGIGAAPTDTNNVFAKTRIRDSGGTPTSITVLAGEILDVRYELRTEITLADATGTASGNPFTARNFSVTAFGSRTLTTISPPWANLVAESGGTIALAAVTSSTGYVNSADFSGGTVASTFAAYTNGNYYRDFTVTFGTAVTHASNQVRGVRLIHGSAAFGYGTAVLFTNPIGKTNLQTFTLTGRMSWGRAP